jgi:hypothetical protein
MRVRAVAAGEKEYKAQLLPSRSPFFLIKHAQKTIPLPPLTPSE